MKSRHTLQVVLVVSVYLALNAATLAQSPTGPFADESAYESAALEKTTNVSGEDVVGVVRAVELNVDDQVADKCWTNSSAVSARIRAELETFGIAVYQEPLAFRTVFSPVLQISALGYRTNSGLCIGSIKLQVFYWGATKMGSLGYTNQIFQFQNPVLLWEANSLFSGPSNLDDQFVDQAQEWVDTFISDVAKARRTPGVEGVLETWPKPDAMTVKEFDIFVKGLSTD